MPFRFFFGVLVALMLAMPLQGAVSYYETAPDDSQAVVLRPGTFGAVGDGVADDTAALQAAIDRVQEQTVRGIVLVESGRYRVSDTLRVWSGIRLIGYGAMRPVFCLGANAVGFDGEESRYLVHFASYRPAAGETVRDANPGTFYSGLSNIDLEIGEGNPAAVGVRAHFAQHGFLAHAEFRVGSGRAGVEEVGNEIDDCVFIGGEYGILTRKPSPSWPFVLIDASFSGQRVAAICTEEAGMTIIRGRFSDVPTAVLINPERAEALYVQDSRFERVSGPAIVISDESNARTQINLVNVTCESVPVLARLRESGREFAGPAARYGVAQFSHGQHLADFGGRARIETRFDAEPVEVLPPAEPTDGPTLPATTTWHNVRASGAKGDGEADDTEAIRAAIAAHRVVYFPSGRYRVSDTIELREDTVLVGLNPITTQIALADHSPAFRGFGADEINAAGRSGWVTQFPIAQGTGGPKGLLETAEGGAAMVVGLGLDPGDNNRAVAAIWKAGADSLMDDVRFLGGHGTYLPDGTTVPVYNASHTGDANATRPWGAQYWSLWVTKGGGGTFKNIWTPSPYAQAGMYVSDTRTRGRVYAMSSEHHVRAEVQLRRVANWSFYALQFEEERVEGAVTQPLAIEDCEDLWFANTYLYRVMTTYSPHEAGVSVARSRNLRFRGVHAYGPSKFTCDVTLKDVDRGENVWARELAWFDVSGEVRRGDAEEPGNVFARGGGDGGVRRLAGGFNHIDSLVTDGAGNVLFVDARWQRIYRWESGESRLRLLRDAPLEPVALAPARDGTVLVVTRVGTVFAFDPAAEGEAITVLRPQPAKARPDATAWIPLNRWRDEHNGLARMMERAPWHFVSPDGSIFIPADEAFVQAGTFRSYFSTIDLIRSYGLGPVVSGRPTAVADEFGQKTYLFEGAEPDGTLTQPRLLAEEGEAMVVTGPDGNVYVAAGEVFVYAPDGRVLDRLALPERPTGLAFGGADGRTLFVGARSGLFAVRLR